MFFQMNEKIEYLAQYVIPVLSLLLSFCAIYISVGQSQKLSEANKVAEESMQIAAEAKALASQAGVLAQNSLPKGVKVEDNFIVTDTVVSGDTEQVVESVKAVASVGVASAEEAFGLIYDTPAYNGLIYNYFKPKVAMENSEELAGLVNVFDEVGDAYCDGSITTADLNAYLGKTLRLICTNPDMEKFFPSGKNGLAILCQQIIPNSRYSKTIVPDSLGACDFVKE